MRTSAYLLLQAGRMLKRLIEILALALMAAGCGAQFTLALGKVSNDDLARLEYNHEWYRDSPWDSFDPSKLTADQLEKMAMTLRPQTASTDAWLAYDRLLADGEVSIAVHFGWDYW